MHKPPIPVSEMAACTTALSDLQERLFTHSLAWDDPASSAPAVAPLPLCAGETVLDPEIRCDQGARTPACTRPPPPLTDRP